MRLLKNNIAIILLVVIAIILGVLVALKYLPSVKLPQLGVASKEEKQAAKVVTPNPNIPEFVKKLSPDEQKVLNTPPPDATVAVRKAHYELAKKIAVSADYLDVADCKPVKPLVMKVDMDSINNNVKDVLVKNSSNEDHTISINKDKAYTIKAHGEETIHYDIANGAGVYGYGCDHTPYAIGFFLIQRSPTETPAKQ